MVFCVLLKIDYGYILHLVSDNDKRCLVDDSRSEGTGVVARRSDGGSVVRTDGIRDMCNGIKIEFYPNCI